MGRGTQEHPPVSRRSGTSAVHVRLILTSPLEIRVGARRLAAPTAMARDNEGSSQDKDRERQGGKEGGEERVTQDNGEDKDGSHPWQAGEMQC